jgi:hypothetical protein
MRLSEQHSLGTHSLNSRGFAFIQGMRTTRTFSRHFNIE